MNNFNTVRQSVSQLSAGKYLIKFQNDKYLKIDTKDHILGFKDIELLRFVELSEASYFQNKEEVLDYAFKLLTDIFEDLGNNELNETLNISIIPLSELLDNIK